MSYKTLSHKENEEILALNSNSKFDSLQIGRGLAALLVVLFHLTHYASDRLNFTFLGRIFEFGFSGVDFFFVLSGFIIFYSNYRDFGRKDKLQNYFLRRTIRIFPPYWIFTLVKFGLLILLPGLSAPDRLSLWTVLASFSLFPLPWPTVYPIISVAWTLSYELLFYFLFGLGIRFGKKLLFRIFIIWAVFIVILNLFDNLQTSPFSLPYLVRFLFYERNLEFILGCVIAYVIKEGALKFLQQKSSKIPLFLIIFGTILFAMSGYFIWQNGEESVSFFLLFGIPSFLIVLGICLFKPNNDNQRSKNRLYQRVYRLLVFQGDASYSIYLTHFLFYDFLYFGLKMTGILQHIAPSLVCILMLVTALSGGMGAYWFLERPLVNSAKLWLLRRNQVKGIHAA